MLRRRSMAPIREIVRKGKKNLTKPARAGEIGVDLLVDWLRGGRSREDERIAIGRGLQVVIANKAILDFVQELRPTRVKSLRPGVTLEEVAASMGFAPEVAKSIRITGAPNEEQL